MNIIYNPNKTNKGAGCRSAAGRGHGRGRACPDSFEPGQLNSQQARLPRSNLTEG